MDFTYTGLHSHRIALQTFGSDGGSGVLSGEAAECRSVPRRPSNGQLLSKDTQRKLLSKDTQRKLLPGFTDAKDTKDIKQEQTKTHFGKVYQMFGYLPNLRKSSRHGLRVKK